MVDLGAGLDSGFYRVDPPASVDWYSVDLPGITALRDEVLPPAPHSHSVPVSLADEHWPDAIPADRPTMLIADGLFAFLTEPVIAGIFRRITDHFRSGELAFNDYGRHRLGEPRWRSSCTRRRCSRTSEASGAIPDSRTRTIPRRGIRGCSWSRRPA